MHYGRVSMGEEEETITLHCSKCNTSSGYKKTHSEAFSRVRCKNCSETISIIAYKISEHLQQLREIFTNPTTSEQASTIADIWDFVLRNSDELQNVDPDFRFDTCVELLLNGVTFIPGNLRSHFKGKCIILFLLADNFDPIPFLPANSPQFETDIWMKILAVHSRVTQNCLQEGEDILLFEKGLVNIGNDSRIKLGTIVLTNKRLIVIGREDMMTIHKQLYLKYQGITNFSIQTYKYRSYQDKSVYGYLITPEPHIARIFSSIDYFDLQDLTCCDSSLEKIRYIFSNQLYVGIKRPVFSRPLNEMKNLPVEWIESKLPANQSTQRGRWIGSKLLSKQKTKTGDFKIVISLVAETDTLRDLSDFRERFDILERAIKGTAAKAHQTGPQLS